MNKNFFENLKSDFPASIVVFLVAVPLCLGIALASIPVDYLSDHFMAGIIAGIVGGIVVGIISGSPLGVSGPAAGLISIVFGSIEQLGSFQIFLLAVVIAGALQIILGFVKAGVIGLYFPSSVIKGMLAGIGIIIIIKQIPYALGSYDKSFSGWFQDISWPVICITMVSLAILILWEMPFMKRIKLFTLIQGPLVAVLSAIGLGHFFRDSLKSKTYLEKTGISKIDPETLTEMIDPATAKLVNVEVLDSLSDIGSLVIFPDFTHFTNPQVYVVAFTIAIVASLETLLCVEATDKLDPHKRITPTNRELVAQGAGNMLSGFIGGLPITQVIVRSSANIQSGGNTKLAAILHGLLLFACVLFTPHFLNMIPLSCLSAILFVVGFKLAKPSLFIEMRAKGMQMFIPYVVTILVMSFTFDLLVGIGVGLFVALLFLLYNNFIYPKSNPTLFELKKGSLKIVFSENVSFLQRAKLKLTLDKTSDETNILIDGSNSKSVHNDVLDIIRDFKNSSLKRKGSLEIIGLQI